MEYLAHLPIYLHGSLQCHAQLTCPFTFIKLHVHSHNYFPNASTSACWFSVAVHFYNWHSSNTHAHSFNYFSSQQIGNTNIDTYIYLRLANNGNINLAANIYRLMWSTGKRVAVSWVFVLKLNFRILTNHQFINLGIPSNPRQRHVFSPQTMHFYFDITLQFLIMKKRLKTWFLCIKISCLCTQPVLLAKELHPP